MINISSVEQQFHKQNNTSRSSVNANEKIKKVLTALVNKMKLECQIYKFPI